MSKLNDAKLVLKMRRQGIVNPIWTLRAAREAKLPLDLACAFLEQESNGGQNVFGHDPTIFIGAGKVTRRKYLAYKQFRGHTHMQGVGPMQLTWWSTQDEADALGGCDKPLYNMTVGFKHAADNIHRLGLHAGIAAYNGSGQGAWRYAESVLANRAKWTKRL